MISQATTCFPLVQARQKSQTLACPVWWMSPFLICMCPGTQVYMASEALNKPPIYSEKLDGFSFGVLIVQVLTWQFPDPSNTFHSMEVCQPGNSSIKFQAQVLVPEDRHKCHINQVEENRLLPVALECLNDNSRQRPTASELCQQLEALEALKKRDHSYSKSKVNLKMCLDHFSPRKSS